MLASHRSSVKLSWREASGEKSRVRVRLRDKHELKGYISQIDQDSFQLEIDQDGFEVHDAKDRLVTLPYAEVEKIRDCKPRPGNAIVGLMIVVVVAVAAIVVLEVAKPKHQYP